MKSTRKAKAARRAVHRTSKPAPLSLSARVERLERHYLFKECAEIADAIPQAPRFINLGDDGKPYPAIVTDKHTAVLQTATGLIWTAAPLSGGKNMTHAEATAAAAALDLLGHKDWRLPTVQELLSIIDYDRWDPAVDPAHFKGPYGWTWSSTLVKGMNAPAGCARDVGLGPGYSGWADQGTRSQALAVRASQQLGLLG